MASSGPEPSTNRSQTAGSPLNRKQRLNSGIISAEPSRSRVASRSRATSSRHNKLYRGPPTPPPEVQYERERSFVLDCKAVSHISNDYSTANPKLGSVIPPYNSQYDHHTNNYFQFFGLKKTLKKTGQVYREYLIKTIQSFYFI